IGADLGVVASFFITPWTILAPNLETSLQAWLLSEAATRLLALARLTEAVEPLHLSMKMEIEMEEWRGAANGASNLSQLELLRGDISAAVDAGEQSVTYAEHSGHAWWQMVSRVTLANALHQMGRFKESRHLFKDAESRQALLQPKYPR